MPEPNSEPEQTPLIAALQRGMLPGANLYGIIAGSAAAPYG